MRALLLAAVAILAVGVISGCGSDGDGVFDEEEFPFTFDYPDDWSESDDAEAETSVGAEAEETHAMAADDDNAMVIQSYTLQLEVDESNIDQAKVEFDRLIAEVDPEADGTIGDVVGYPSLTYDDLSAGESTDLRSRVVVFFDGDQEYLLNCQFDEEHRDEVLEACDQALDTLEPK